MASGKRPHLKAAQNNRQRGSSGEQQAARFLIDNGYRIIRRNFRNSLGEIDIVAEQGGILCFIEVKTRSSPTFGFPAEAVTVQKQQKIARVAASYLSAYHPEGRDCRFDVVTVTGRDGGFYQELIKDAFRL